MQYYVTTGSGGTANVDVNFTVEDDFYEIIDKYNTATKIYDSLGPLFFDPPHELFDNMRYEIDVALAVLLDEDDKEYSTIVKSMFSRESLLYFNGNSSFYNDSFKCNVSYASTGVDNSVTPEDIGEWRRVKLKGKGLSFEDFDTKFIYSAEGNFNFLSEVCYIDSISLFDFDYLSQFKYGKEHVGHLLKQIRNDDGYMAINIENGILEQYKMDIKSKISDEDITKMDSVGKYISNIIGGNIIKEYEHYLFDKPFGNEYYFFKPLNSKDSFKHNISSGIQQISIIQLLLSNYKLQPYSFLIIDEPEVNLHPDWQFKFAEILVLLAKELDITIYLNSHSPMFIESLAAFTEYYDMQDDVNYYLTEESEVEGKFNFTKIPSDKLYKIYDNLGNVYDKIDQLRLKKRLGE